MKVRVLKLFGREVLRIESHYEATVSDVVRALLAQRAAQSEEDSLEECACCGAAFDPDAEEDYPDEDDDEVNARFADLTERLIWGPAAEEEEPEDS